MLPPADCRIDIERIELDAAADPADTFGRQQRRAAAEKRVEDKVAAGRTIENRIGDQRDRFYRGMKRGKVPLFALSPEIVQAWVMPDVGAVATMLAQLDVIPVRRPAVLEHEDQLVLAPVEGTHAGIVLDPHTHVFKFGINSERCGQQLVLMAPIHAHVVQGAGGAIPNQQFQGGGEKTGELGRGQLPGSHQELAVAHPPLAGHMTSDGHVVGRIGKDNSRRSPLQQPVVSGLIERVAAEQPMPTQLPEITRPADRRLVEDRRHLIGGIGVASRQYRQTFDP